MLELGWGWNLGLETNLGSGKILVLKDLGPEKKLGPEKYLGSKNILFPDKNLGPEIFLNLNKNLGLKFCLVPKILGGRVDGWPGGLD